MVWLFWPQPPIRQRFKKPHILWTGLWKIEEFQSPLFVKIRHVKKKTRQMVHINRLLSCLTPQAKHKPCAIFAIFTPYESVLGVDDRSEVFSISQGALPWQPILWQNYLPPALLALSFLNGMDIAKWCLYIV